MIARGHVAIDAILMFFLIFAGIFAGFPAVSEVGAAGMGVTMSS
jgi:hypothetical protein